MVFSFLQERRKQQRRFRDAQLIQREMSQLERQYDELEEVGRDIENALRESEDGEFRYRTDTTKISGIQGAGAPFTHVKSEKNFTVVWCFTLH